MRLWKTLVAIAGATALLGSLATAASARSLSTSSQTIRVQFREIRFIGLFGTTNCQVTVEGSFHERTTAKIVGRLVGFISSARLGPCSSGTATILTESLPWHAAYSAFSGTLPNISSITATSIGVAWRIREPGGGSNCLSRTTVEHPMTGTFNRDLATRTLTTSVVGGEIETDCGIPGTFNSDGGPIRVPVTGALITLTLI
ncbi:MAG TPA: hypothetical protein VF250_00925 [Conexibacter sp.]